MLSRIHYHPIDAYSNSERAITAERLTPPPPNHCLRKYLPCDGRLFQATLSRISQRGFAARNLILVQCPTTTTKMVRGYILSRIFLVDHNQADILEYTALDEVESSPNNPASVFWKEYIWQESPGWVLHKWEDARL